MNVFCDNYLEIVKKRVYNGTKQEKASAFYTLYNSLLVILKLFAPITPFITEELYQKHYKMKEKVKSIHISEWPKPFKIKEERRDKEKFKLFLDVIAKVRKEKSKSKKPMNSEIILTIEKKQKESLKGLLEDLKAVTNSLKIEEGNFFVEFK